MKHRYAIGISISVFLLFYFLFPIMQIDLWCFSKEHRLNEAASGIAETSSMFMYTVFLLNGEQVEYGNTICNHSGTYK